MTYLGSLLCSDGTAGSELKRRIGAAREVFDKLCRVWDHSNITVARKLQIYSACVASRLLYNLHSLWLNTAGTRKLDAFHLKCLRRLLRVAPSFYSRISNQTILERTNSRNLSGILLERQLRFLGELASRDDDDILRQSVLQPGTFEPHVPEGPRKQGRPRTTWASAIFKHAIQAAESAENLSNYWQGNPQSKAAWRTCVRKYCST